jgi:ubiquinone/menaquinone biosynthesis C-methylase UbiE
VSAVVDEPDDELSVEAGFTRVDDQPDTGYLVAGMDQTAQWTAVRELRRWERARLALGPGDHVLDVGCGVGDVITELSLQVQPDGRAVGIDASEAMLAVGRRRADAAGRAVELRTGDALALDVPDGSFDACRSERMLQWVADVDAAVAEMVRVLRPGGRIGVIDTDWRTLVVDLPTSQAVQAVRIALENQRGEGARAGGRLLNACRDVGVVDLEVTAATHVWSEWDPEVDAAPSGFFPLAPVTNELVALGFIDAELARRFIDELHESARAGRFFMALSMIAVCGRRPDE